MSDLTEIIISDESRQAQLAHLDAVSALHTALTTHDNSALRSVLDHTFTEAEYTEALHIAVQAGNLEVLPTLYSAGAKVRVEGPEIKRIYGVVLPDQPQAYLDIFQDLAVGNNYARLIAYIKDIKQRRLYEDATIALLHSIECNKALREGKKIIQPLKRKLL